MLYFCHVQITDYCHFCHVQITIVIFAMFRSLTCHFCHVQITDYCYFCHVQITDLLTLFPLWQNPWRYHLHPRICWWTSQGRYQHEYLTHLVARVRISPAHLAVAKMNLASTQCWRTQDDLTTHRSPNAFMFLGGWWGFHSKQMVALQIRNMFLLLWRDPSYRGSSKKLGRVGGQCTGALQHTGFAQSSKGFESLGKMG